MTDGPDRIVISCPAQHLEWTHGSVSSRSCGTRVGERRGLLTLQRAGKMRCEATGSRGIQFGSHCVGRVYCFETMKCSWFCAQHPSWMPALVRILLNLFRRETFGNDLRANTKQTTIPAQKTIFGVSIANSVWALPHFPHWGDPFTSRDYGKIHCCSHFPQVHWKITWSLCAWPCCPVKTHSSLLEIWYPIPFAFEDSFHVPFLSCGRTNRNNKKNMHGCALRWRRRICLRGSRHRRFPRVFPDGTHYSNLQCVFCKFQSMYTTYTRTHAHSHTLFIFRFNCDVFDNSGKQHLAFHSKTDQIVCNCLSSWKLFPDNR